MTKLIKGLKEAVASEADEPTNCPHCKVSLLGDLIPDEHLGGYPKGTHYKLEIGVEDPMIYDGTLFYRCPFCEGTWGGYRSLYA